ncbi:MAG: hypothetical protein HRU13_10230, partial [Phycisphaerales bacterium]|nr:hypothetical protein [Phycisphaerales bacterium]
RTPAWPAQIVLNDCRYDAIHTQSPLDAASRLAWLANHDRSMAYLPPPGWPGTISPVQRVVLRLLPQARAGYWSKGAGPCDPQPYRQLASVLRRQGHEGDANAVLTALGWRRLMPLFRERWRESGRGKVKAVVLFALNVLYGAIVGHGYARFRPLYWILAFWALGSVVFWIDGGRVMQPTQAVPLRAWTKAEAAGFDGTPMQPIELAAWARAHGGRIADEDVAWANAYPRFNPVVYSLDALLPLVDFHQEEYWTPRNGPGWVQPWPAQQNDLAWWLRLRFPSPQWWIKAAYLPLHIAMGWIVATLFAASFTRLARRD